jgi:hypothetical protein
MLRSIEIDIVIVRGNAGLIHARSRQMRSLLLMGRSEDDCGGTWILSCGIFLISRVIRLRR